VQGDEIQHTMRRGRDSFMCAFGGGGGAECLSVTSVPDSYVCVQQTNQTEPITLQACTPSRSSSQRVPVPLTAVQPFGTHTAAPHHISTRGTVRYSQLISCR
jgi:hypothetical protein